MSAVHFFHERGLLFAGAELLTVGIAVLNGSRLSSGKFKLAPVFNNLASRRADAWLEM